MNGSLVRKGWHLGALSHHVYWLVLELWIREYFCEAKCRCWSGHRLYILSCQSLRLSMLRSPLLRLHEALHSALIQLSRRSHIIMADNLIWLTRWSCSCILTCLLLATGQIDSLSECFVSVKSSIVGRIHVDRKTVQHLVYSLLKGFFEYVTL